MGQPRILANPFFVGGTERDQTADLRLAIILVIPEKNLKFQLQAIAEGRPMLSLDAVSDTSRPNRVV